MRKRKHRPEGQTTSKRTMILLVTCLVFSGLAIYGLRNNNLTALKLRDQVIAADKINGDVEGLLRQLRTHIYGHMNTNLAQGDTAIKPPIQLKYRYDRLLKIEKDRVAAINAKVYSDAQSLCEQQYPVGLLYSGRVPCVQNYIAAHGVTAQPIPDAEYKFDFLAPVWSPDLAGWSLLLAATSGILFMVSIISTSWLNDQRERF